MKKKRAADLLSRPFFECEGERLLGCRCLGFGLHRITSGDGDFDAAVLRAAFNRGVISDWLALAIAHDREAADIHAVFG